MVKFKRCILNLQWHKVKLKVFLLTFVVYFWIILNTIYNRIYEIINVGVNCVEELCNLKFFFFNFKNKF
jgi:hypothetical protein